MEKIFKLKENGTTVRTEILAGLTTFMTMAYIIALNPNLLTGFAVGTPLWNGVFLATCIASAIGTACMAFLANKPFAMAPGMGLNSFFAVVVANIAVINDCDYTSAFQAALVIILIEGIVFLVLTVLKVREKIVEAIPLGVRYGIAPAIGLMLMNVGLGSNIGIYSENGGPFYMMRDFFGALTPSIIKGNMGSGYDTMVLTVVTAFLGVFVMVVLAKKGIKAAVLLGMLFSSVLYWIGSFAFLGVNPFASLETASFVPPFAAIIPGAATSAALIYVGVLMLQGLKNVNFDDMDQMLPVSIMLIGMPISGSIGHAIGLGLISYAVVKLLSGKAKDVSVLTYVISVLFLIKFFAVV